jgi:hypothetical protein
LEVVGVLLVICTTEFSTCLNILLRDKGLEEELVPLEGEFIRCCCATAVDGSINPSELLSLLLPQIQQLLQLQIGFSLGGRLRIIHQIYFYA